MATRTDDTHEDIGTLKTDVAVLKNDVNYIKNDLKKVVDFVDDNKGGITTASILNSQLVTVVIGLIIMAGIAYAVTKGGSL